VRKVLLLNASEEILKVISWHKAVKLVLDGKARKPYGHDDEYEIKTVSGIFRLPTALVLVQYVHIPYKNVAVNKDNVLRRDNYTCGYCNKKLSSSTGTVDHLVPQSRGGKNTWLNVVAACKDCNNNKDNMSVKEFEKKHNKKLNIEPHIPSRDFMVLTGVDVKTHETWTRWVEI
jgi:5-methylcytosine-specific restriction endonuclease McrA